MQRNLTKPCRNPAPWGSTDLWLRAILLFVLLKFSTVTGTEALIQSLLALVILLQVGRRA